MYRKLLDYISLRASLSSIVSAEEVFFAGSSSSQSNAEKITQRSHVGQHEMNDMVDDMASQILSLTLTVRRSRTAEGSHTKRTFDEVCLYYQKSAHFCTNCSKNEHSRVWCVSCGKLGHCESRCVEKQKKDSQCSNVVFSADETSSARPMPTVSVTLFKLNKSSASSEVVVPSIQRTTGGRTVTKLGSQANASHSNSTWTQRIRVAPIVPDVISKKRKPKWNFCNQDLDGSAAVYEAVTERASPSSILTFRLLFCGNGIEDESDIRHLLFRGARESVESLLSQSPPRRLAFVASRIFTLRIVRTRRATS